MTWFHRHRWVMMQAFATAKGFTWPPMWACPCGEMRDVQDYDEWGLGN